MMTFNVITVSAKFLKFKTLMQFYCKFNNLSLARKVQPEGSNINFCYNF